MQTTVENLKIPIFDRIMFWLLRMKPLPVRKKEGTQVKVMTVLALYGQSLKNYPWSISFAVMASIFSSCALVMSPYVFKKFLDLLGTGTQQTAGLIDIIYLFL